MTTVTPPIGRARRLVLGLFITALVLTGALLLAVLLYGASRLLP